MSIAYEAGELAGEGKCDRWRLASPVWWTGQLRQVQEWEIRSMPRPGEPGVNGVMQGQRLRLLNLCPPCAAYVTRHDWRAPA